MKFEDGVMIDGSWLTGSGVRLHIEDPRTGEAFAEVSSADRDQVDAAVRSAAGAFEAWSNTPVSSRVELLHRLAAILSERKSVFARLIEQELGVPGAVVERLHVNLAIAAVETVAGDLQSFPMEETRGRTTVLREPTGVVAAITPWNYPLYQVVVKVAPALAAGATVVLKPSELTPLSAIAFTQAVIDAGFPPGVLNLTVGRGIGEYLVGHEKVGHVSFTGSTETGRRIAEIAGAGLKRVTLELGGKSASIVLQGLAEDDFRRAVKATANDCFLNSGQSCTALSRLIVPSDRLAETESIVADVARAWVPGERLGPVASQTQLARIEGFLAPDSLGPDARIVTSEDTPLPDRGWYLRPTAVSGVQPTDRIVQDEVFGPVLVLLPANSDDEAVELANATEYGLSGAVWAPDDASALAAAQKMRTGQVRINGGWLDLAAPFGGFGQSGVGRELGPEGIAEYLEYKSVTGVG